MVVFRITSFSDHCITGYYATGPDVTLVAITPPQGTQRKPATHKIASANLSLRKDRIRSIRRLINLAGLFQTLADMIPMAGIEFATIERSVSDFVQAVQGLT
jgi:hypothetical protein